MVIEQQGSVRRGSAKETSGKTSKGYKIGALMSKLKGEIGGPPTPQRCCCSWLVVFSSVQCFQSFLGQHSYQWYALMMLLGELVQMDKPHRVRHGLF